MLALCALASPVRSEIKAGDSLQILIRGVPSAEKPKVEGQYVVGKSGTIKIPLTRKMVTAAGLNAEKLAREIERVYREAEIYTQPSIEVITKEIEPPGGARVSVGGQVRRPGAVAFRNGMTLLQAVQAAGDLTAFGNKKRVYLTRGKKRWAIDMREQKGQGVLLQADDTIEVDQRGF